MRKEFLDSPLSRLTDSKCRFYIAKKKWRHHQWAAALSCSPRSSSNQRGEITSFLSHWSHSQFSLLSRRRRCSFWIYKSTSPLSKVRLQRARASERERIEMKTTTTRKKKIKWSTWLGQSTKTAPVAINSFGLLRMHIRSSSKQSRRKHKQKSAPSEKKLKRFFCAGISSSKMRENQYSIVPVATVVQFVRRRATGEPNEIAHVSSSLSLSHQNIYPIDDIFECIRAPLQSASSSDTTALLVDCAQFMQKRSPSEIKIKTNDDEDDERADHWMRSWEPSSPLQ